MRLKIHNKTFLLLSQNYTYTQMQETPSNGCFNKKYIYRFLNLRQMVQLYKYVDFSKTVLLT